MKASMARPRYENSGTDPFTGLTLFRRSLSSALVAGAAEDWSRRLAQMSVVKLAVSLAFSLNPIAIIGGKMNPSRP
jgi:hypothetical protein